jgi:hypothetical protein
MLTQKHLDALKRLGERLRPESVRDLPIREKIRIYRSLRDARKQLADAVAELDKPLRATMDQIEAYALEHMAQDGVTSYKSSDGRMTQTTLRRVKIVDWGAFLQWAKDHDELGMVTRAATKSEVLSYLDNHGELPPGLTLDEVLSVSFSAK